jgi:hypothetical protein
MNSWELFILKVTPEGKMILEAALIPLLLLGALIAAVWGFTHYRRRPMHEWEPVELEIPFPGTGKVKIKPNYEVLRIAHGAWVELATRKAGILFERDHDVIVELYDSWYKLFGEMRQLARQVPAHRLRQDEDTRKTVELIVNTLNKGLRPHLTQWHARFRHWYEREARDHPNESPQEIQARYPRYRELVDDLERVNREMLLYMGELKKLVSAAEQ